MGRDPKVSRVGILGGGAAGSAIARLLVAYGVSDVRVYDPNASAARRLAAFGITATDIDSVTSAVDVLIAASGQPGSVKDSIRAGQIVVALSNPRPDIEPERAFAAGAAVAVDGTVVNNALAYPGLFRGALDARSRKISQAMMIAAAEAIAAAAGRGEIVPGPLRLEVHDAVAKAVAAAASAAGLAGTAVP